MTREKNPNSRKRDNKFTVYLPDDQRDYIVSSPEGRSELIQEAIRLLIAFRRGQSVYTPSLDIHRPGVQSLKNANPSRHE